MKKNGFDDYIIQIIFESWILQCCPIKDNSVFHDEASIAKVDQNEWVVFSNR